MSCASSSGLRTSSIDVHGDAEHLLQLHLHRFDVLALLAYHDPDGR